MYIFLKDSISKKISRGYKKYLNYLTLYALFQEIYILMGPRKMADINESRCEEYATIVFQNQNALDLAIERLKQVKTELEKAKSQCEEY